MRSSDSINSPTGRTNSPASIAADDRGPWCDYHGRDGYCRDFRHRRTTDNLRRYSYGDGKALWFCPDHIDYAEDFRPASVADVRKAFGWALAAMDKLAVKPKPRMFDPGPMPTAPLPETKP